MNMTPTNNIYLRKTWLVAIIMHATLAATTSTEPSMRILQRKQRRSQSYQTKKYAHWESIMDGAPPPSQQTTITVALTPKGSKNTNNPSSHKSPFPSPSPSLSLSLNVTLSLTSSVNLVANTSTNETTTGVTSSPSPSPTSISKKGKHKKNKPTLSPIHDSPTSSSLTSSIPVVLSGIFPFYSSSFPPSGPVLEGAVRDVSRLKIDRFGLEFGPTTESFLLDNDAITATELALANFLATKIDYASNVTIEAVDATFIPYSTFRGRRILPDREKTANNDKQNVGNTVIYYQGEVVMWSTYNNTTNAFKEPADEVQVETSSVMPNVNTVNAPLDVFAILQDSRNVDVLKQNLKSNSDEFSNITKIMFAASYPTSASQVVQKTQSWTSSLQIGAVGTFVVTSCFIFSCLAAFFIYRAKQLHTKVGDESASSKVSDESSGSSTGGGSLIPLGNSNNDRKRFSNSLIEDDISSSTTSESMTTFMGSKFGPSPKRQRKQIKAQIKFDCNLSTINEGDCETQASGDTTPKKIWDDSMATASSC